MEWSPVGHWSQWPEVTSPRQLLPEDEKNWRANCFCSNRLDTGRQEAVDFSLPSNPLLLLFPPNDTICGIINKQGVKFHKRRNSSQSVNNSDFDLRQALLINVSLVPTLFWWLWYKFRLNILHMLFLNVLRLSPITHMYNPDLILHFALSLTGPGSMVTCSWVRTRGVDHDATPAKWRSPLTPQHSNPIYCLEIKTRHALRAGRMEQLFNWMSCNELFTTLFPAQGPVCSPVHWPQKLSFIQSLLKQFREFSFKNCLNCGRRVEAWLGF